MSYYNQNVRSNPSKERPTGLYDDIINVGRIIVLGAPPTVNDGVDGDYFIDNSSGDLYGKKIGGVWGPPIYSFTTGGGGTITNLANIGGGVRSFKGLNGTVAELRTISSAGNQIDIAEDLPESDALNFSMSAAYKPVLLSGYRDNGVVSVSIGSGAGNPNGVLGSPDYNLGSIYTQVGASDSLWVLSDPGAKTWVQIAGEGVGVLGLTNVGTGSDIYLDNVSGTARLKRLQGTTGEIEIDDTSDPLTNTINIDPVYKPLTLSNVDNVKIGYENISGPLGTDDVTKGYVQGSLFIETEVGGANIIWVCVSPTPAGSAQWEQYTNTTAVRKDFANWSDVGGQPQAISFDFADVNFGPNPNPTAYAQLAPGSKLSALFDGSRTVFRRAAVTTEKAYRVSLTMNVQDFEASTTRPANYDIQFIRKTGLFVANQSRIGFVIPVHTTSSVKQSVTVSFIWDEPLTGQQDYYFQIRGRLGQPGADSVAQGINIDYWSVAFSEI